MDPSIPLPNQQPIQQANVVNTTSSSRSAGIIIKLGLIFLLIIVLAFTSIAVLSVYAKVDIPLLSTDRKKDLALLIYRIPFTPKTAEQILLAASDAVLPTSYNQEFSISANLGAGAVEAGSLDLKIKGPIDFKDAKKMNFDISVDLGVNYAGLKYQASGKIRKIEDTIYGKIDNLSDSIYKTYSSFSSSIYGGGAEESANEEVNKKLQDVFTNWVSYSTAGIESQARKALEEREREQSLVDSTRQKAQEILLRKNILPEVKKLEDDTIEGIATYHLQLNPSKEKIKELILEFYPEKDRSDKNVVSGIDELTNVIESLSIDAWFGKNDSILRKVSIQSQVKLDSLMGAFSGLTFGGFSTPSELGSLITPKLQLSLVLTIKDIGKPVVVEVPSPLKTFEEYSSLLQEATKTEAQKEQEALKKQYDADFKIISTAMLGHYVAKGVFPVQLVDLVGEYLVSDDDFVGRLSSYQYKISSDAKDYLVYIEYKDILFSEYYTPYYGITSIYKYPHQLDKTDFDKVQ